MDMLVLNITVLEVACYDESLFSMHEQGLGQPVQTIYWWVNISTASTTEWRILRLLNISYSLNELDFPWIIPKGSTRLSLCQVLISALRSTLWDFSSQLLSIIFSKEINWFCFLLFFVLPAWIGLDFHSLSHEYQWIVVTCPVSTSTKTHHKITVTTMGGILAIRGVLYVLLFFLTIFHGKSGLMYPLLFFW